MGSSSSHEKKNDYKELEDVKEEKYKKQRKEKDKSSCCSCKRICCCICILIFLGIIVGLIALIITFGAEGYTIY